ncbi:50S ribosome-binding GTPase [Methylomonas sp. EFPC3]|uniref:GTPase n=1 Tax=Methylomonas sp. EFPC3 TaxID=3021710 RepID=UPI002415BA42|nr:GTPase [Methylomonas sp. EFPC3]WFP49304.1 50S ribosome-binding GTPase [Methylomonas sp. EFPC3]
MKLAYSTYFKELNHVVKDAESLIAGLDIPEAARQLERLEEARELIGTETPLRLVLLGEFSAGKSSLISALTGADVKIDADVCTDTISEYSWQGLTLVDTPGIQAQGVETDHDRIAREATVKADLVLFVITNELFNPRLAAYLKYVLDDTGLGLAKKAAIVVNKIDRETNPTEILLGQIQKVLGPHLDVPIYFCASSKFTQAKGMTEELRTRFIRQSRINELVYGINQFVDDAGTLGRLTTPLQIVAEMTDLLQAEVADSEDDKNRLELLRRQKKVLQDLQLRLLEIRKNWKQQIYSTILRQAEPAAQQIDDSTNEQGFISLFESGMANIAGEVSSIYDGVQFDLAQALSETENKLEELGHSQLAKEVELGSTQRAERIKATADGNHAKGQAYVAKFTKFCIDQPLLKASLEEAAKNAKNLRDIVYSVGKAFGKKFRPWEAVKTGQWLGLKTAEWAGKAQKALPFIGIALDLYLQYREEEAKEEKARYFASLRMSLRNVFAEQAKLEAEALEAGVVKVSEGPVAEALASLDSAAEEVSNSDIKNAVMAKKIAALRERCTHLRTQIMGGVRLETSES